MLPIAFDIIHDDVIKWKHLPRYWPFMMGIHRSLVDSPHKGQWRGALVLSLICAWTNRLSKQSRCQWFGTPSRSLRRHCNYYSLAINDLDYVLLISRHLSKWRSRSGEIWRCFKGQWHAYCCPHICIANPIEMSILWPVNQVYGHVCIIRNIYYIVDSV